MEGRDGMGEKEEGGEGIGRGRRRGREGEEGRKRRRIVIGDLSLLVGEELEPVERGYLVIEEGRIWEVGKGDPPDGEALNGRGLLALPGLINAHTHIGDTIAKDAGLGKSMEELVHPVHGLKARILSSAPQRLLIEGMAHSLKSMLSYGITCIADFREGGLKGLRLLKRAAKSLGIRVRVLGRMDFYPSHEEIERDDPLPDEAVKQLEGVLEESDGLGISGANEYGYKALRRMGELAQAEGKLLAIHAAESLGAVRKSLELFGKSEVERVLECFRPHFLVHLVHPRPRDLDLLEGLKIPVVCCPSSNAILGNGIPPLAEMAKRGIPIALGTDNVMLNPPDLFREMSYTLKVVLASAKDPQALSPREVLKMATINAAKALRIEGYVGSLEEGKLADLLFLSKEGSLLYSKEPIASIVHRAGPQDVKGVMVEGEWVYGGIPRR